MEIDKIKRVALDRASEEEKKEVGAWGDVSEERKRLLGDAKVFYGEDKFGEQEVAERVEKMWQRMQLPRKKRRVIAWQRWVSVAACVVVVAGVALWMLSGNAGNEKGTVVADSKAIKLILSDGSTHEITAGMTSSVNIPGFEVDAKSTVQRGQNLAGGNAAAVEYSEIIVPRGGEYTLALADGTTVILNSETRVRFPNSFTGRERRIFLSGEAYFDVARDERKPFIVEFQGGKLRVLGTQFNVKAYGGQTTFATLVSGKVEVSSGRDSVVLQPGELCEVRTGDRSLAVREADMMSVLAWKNGEFVFKDVSLEHVMNELARWYDAEVVYDTDDLKNTKLHIYMNRTKTLEEALQVLSKIGSITYEVHGKKIIIKKQ